MYYLYHIPGKKIGVTTDLHERVECQQGYGPEEYDVIIFTEDIDLVSKKPYNKLKCNKMKINVTEQTTTFPCPVNKLKGNLMDSMGLTWETEHGDFHIDEGTIGWILKNVKTSQFTNNRCYVYNKAFSRYYDNHYDYRLDNAKQMNLLDQYNGKCRSGALSPAGIREEEKCSDCDCDYMSQFDLIREWADTRGLYENGDTKTQALKLVEEVGETCRAILKEDYHEITDGIGDCVVVLTNLAELHGVSIEDCIGKAYNEIKGRKGQMANGTYVKDAK